jgi:hypothetical protein
MHALQLCTSIDIAPKAIAAGHLKRVSKPACGIIAPDQRYRTCYDYLEIAVRHEYEERDLGASWAPFLLCSKTNKTREGSTLIDNGSKHRY